ncbi:hypothetical protein [Neodiprion abietis nucleopolyhedrovirus]|uniref:Uncharacterized protein n=1 Tax=Neodiprion abietis nucleopolyhedrovirus TaxID=204507 RepID=Q0ZP50_9CBAC|nr:hypothetical protein [Neodiprion abietis nucleopolyhedrovirus]ABC74904.1 unknown [Neodiprion abietis nucleopolyhedrovirus]
MSESEKDILVVRECGCTTLLHRPATVCPGCERCGTKWRCVKKTTDVCNWHKTRSSKTKVYDCGCRIEHREYECFSGGWDEENRCEYHHEQFRICQNKEKKRQLEERELRKKQPVSKRTRVTGKILISDILNDKSFKMFEKRLNDKTISNVLIRQSGIVKYKKQWYVKDRNTLLFFFKNTKGFYIVEKK